MAQDCDQRLTVNGVVLGETVLDTPRWQVTSFADALKREVRGDDRQVPYVNGRVPYPRRRDRVRMLFPLVIRGDYAAAGTLLADTAWAQQRIANLEVLLAAWEPGSAGLDVDGQAAVTWRRPDGSTKTGLAHVQLPLQVAEPPGTTQFFTAVLDLSVAAGAFA